MAGIVFVLWSVMVFRDYRLDFSDGFPQFVARISIPRPSAPKISNSEVGNLTVSTSSRGDQAGGYEFRISRFKNMAFAHSFRSVEPKKEIAKLKPGKKYYAQVRCYKMNNMGRNVFGLFC